MYKDKVNQWLNEEKREPTPTQIKLINAISQYHPSHFLTVQLPLNWRNGGLEKYNAKLINKNKGFYIIEAQNR